MLPTDKSGIIIPARYASTRLPGKPLVEINGKSLIRRVWERCTDLSDQFPIYIATDSDRILDHCRSFTENIIMTSNECLTGTDRVYEAAKKLGLNWVINVQGDEPLIKPEDILKVAEAYKNCKSDVINAYCKITEEHEYYSLTVPKVVIREDNTLEYMSRAPVPHSKTGKFITSNKQVCIYAFSLDSLTQFAKFGRKTKNEDIEDIEILRFLDLGYEIQMIELDSGNIAVDTPEDVVRVEQALSDYEQANK